MLVEERRREILSLVEERKTVTVEELTRILNASESTVRRDLSQLARMGRINKVHGGATILDRRYIMSDQSMSEKSAIHSREKQEIARYAAKLIEPDDFIYIDAGSTTDRLIDCIEEDRATYMTNSIAHARKLAAKGCRVLLPEGEMKFISEALVGPQTVLSLRRYHFTKGFFGTNGVTDETGFTTPEVDEAMIKHSAMEQSHTRYVLCDSSKFSLISPVTFAEFESAKIITDRITDPDYKKYQNITEVSRQ